MGGYGTGSGPRNTLGPGSGFLRNHQGRRVGVAAGDRRHHAGIDHPDDAALVDALALIAPSEADRQRLLVDNPQRLYRFA